MLNRAKRPYFVSAFTYYENEVLQRNRRCIYDCLRLIFIVDYNIGENINVISK